MQSMDKVPVIAIVGRPNVGKSTLFNRLIGLKHAITSDVAGTTRDRIYYRTNLYSLPVILVDTGGIEYGKKGDIENDVQLQVKIAIADADMIIFLSDAREQLTINDYEAAKELRKCKKPVLFVANKIDNKGTEHNINEFLKIGFGEPLQISAYHNVGISELEEEAERLLKKAGFRAPRANKKKSEIINICLVGKPNAGKSSLVNAILGQNKVIVSDIPGTTRDATDTEFEWEGQKYNLIDTAGIRRRGHIEKGLEKISALRSLQSIERADVVCLIEDFSEGVRKQDQHIASYILEANKGLVLVVNKCDLMEDRQEEEQKLINILRSRFEFLPWAPAIFVSAKEKKNIYKILELAKTIQGERRVKLSDEELDSFLKETVYKNAPPRMRNIRPMFFSFKQVDTEPPTFICEVNNIRIIHFSYRRYLENELRKKYPFTGTAVKIIFRQRGR